MSCCCLLNCCLILLRASTVLLLHLFVCADRRWVEFPEFTQWILSDEPCSLQRNCRAGQNQSQKRIRKGTWYFKWEDKKYIHAWAYVSKIQRKLFCLRVTSTSRESEPVQTIPTQARSNQKPTLNKQQQTQWSSPRTLSVRNWAEFACPVNGLKSTTRWYSCEMLTR